MRKFLIDLFFILLIIFATTIAWHGILNQTIEGEGFYYFSTSNSLVSQEGNIANLAHGIDNFVKIITYIQERAFGGNIQPYMTVEFIFIIVVNISFYIFVKKVTKNSTLAFIAALYEAVYYTGNFQFYARGHYHWFYQRVIEIIPMFASFYFVIKFAENRNWKNYSLALIFFLIALFFAHYTTFLMPFIPIYLTVYSIRNIRGVKEKLKLISFSLPFVLINYFITKDASLNLSIIHPHQTFIESFLLLKDVPLKVSYQLVAVTVPFTITHFLSKYFNLEYQELIITMIAPVYLFYLFIFGNLYKKKSKYFTLSLSSFFSLLAVLFLVVYFNRVKVFGEIQEGRYYYIPAFYVGIIFSCFLNNILKGKNKLIILSVLAAIWISTNTQLISKKIKSTQIFYTQAQAMFDYLKIEKHKLPENSVVFIPNPPAPGAVDFLGKYYTNTDKSVIYLYLDQNWKSKIPEGTNKNKVFVFDYKDKTVIDKSEEYRKMLPL